MGVGSGVSVRTSFASARIFRAAAYHAPLSSSLQGRNHNRRSRRATSTMPHCFGFQPKGRSGCQVKTLGVGMRTGGREGGAPSSNHWTTSPAPTMTMIAARRRYLGSTRARMTSRSVDATFERLMFPTCTLRAPNAPRASGAASRRSSAPGQLVSWSSPKHSAALPPATRTR